MIRFIYIFWLVLIISLEVNSQTFTIDHDSKFIQIKYDGVYHTLGYQKEMDLSGLNDPVGQPQLPVYMYRMPLDKNETIKSINIEEIKEQKIDGTFNIKIQQPLWHQDFDENNMVTADNDQNNFPDKIIDYKGIKYFNGHPIAHFAVHPFRYQSDSGNLYFVEQIRFSINTDIAESKGVIPLQKFLLGNEELITFTKSDQSIELPDLKMVALDWIVDEEEGIPLNYISAGLVDRYIIITTDELAASFEPLAEWKTRKGVPTIIRTLNWVRNNFPDGLDDADRIRNYIRWSYKNRGTKYVMLGGDTELIPSRIITTGGFTFPADYYYADLDGNWNADEDDIFGEAVDKLDGYPETYVSRIPVKTEDEVDRFIQRLFRYERMIDIENPYFPGDVLYLAANLDRENDGRELIMSKIDPQINSEFRRTILTENADIGSDPAPALEALNNNFSIIFTENHGLYHTLRPGARGSNFFTYNIAELTNHDPGIWYVASCYTNDIVKRSLSEMYLLAENGGGVAYIGNSSYEYPFSGIYLQ
ncbi:MAG: C25 family cysteine peptidase, partial [Calditrichaceae bacterium]